MAIIISTDLTLISSADTTTSQGTWSAGTADSDAKVEGAACLYVKYTSAGTKTLTFTPTTNLNIPAGSCIWFWVAWASKSMPATKAAGGLKIKLTSTDTAYWSEWLIAGSDTLPHNGWVYHCINVDSSTDRTNGTYPVNLADIDVITYTFTLAVKGNVSWDAIHFGTTIKVRGGDSGTPADIDDLVSYCANPTNGMGLVSYGDGIYYAQAKIQIGDLTGTDATYFKDTSKVLTFLDKNVGSGYFGITVNGSSGYTTECYFGNPTTEVSGLILTAATASLLPYITATNQYVTNLGLCGCVFQKMGTITLPAYNGSKKVKNCTFETCSEVIVDTGTLSGCNFISSAARAVKISSVSHNVANSNFINCQTAVHHDIGGATGSHLEYNYDALMFSGNTYDIENSASTPNFYIDIDRLNGSNPDVAKINNSNGGSTTILPISVVLTLTGLPAGSDVRIMEAGTLNELDGTDNSGTTFPYSYDYGVYPSVDIIVLHLSYEYFRLASYSPGASNASLPIPLRIDRNYLE